MLTILLINCPNEKVIFVPNFPAAIAENYIQIVKKKLYMLLRGTLSRNWSPALQKITQSLNDTPIERLGWLKPSDIQSETDSVRVDFEKTKHNVKVLKEPSYEAQKKSKDNYKGDLAVGDYVYKQFESKIFDKSFDVSVCVSNQIFLIAKGLE